MDNYAILKIGKMKDSKSMKDAYHHNERIYRVENADPSRIEQNIELVDTMGLSYEDIYNNEISDLRSKGAIDKNIRKDAVRGMEVILSFSREKADDIDIDEWAQDNVAWLDKNFNPKDHVASFQDPDTGEHKTIQIQNLKHVVLHLDESRPHIHAYVIPIDDKGHLNYHHYVSGRNKLCELQTDYARAMEKYDLQRGEEHSVANTEQISRYYNHLLKAVEARLPEPLENESVHDYRQRAEDVYQAALSNHRNELVKRNQEIVHIRSRADKQVSELSTLFREEHQIISDLTGRMSPVEASKDELERELVTMINENRRFKKAIEEHPDRDTAEEVFGKYNQMINWELARETELDI